MRHGSNYPRVRPPMPRERDEAVARPRWDPRPRRPRRSSAGDRTAPRASAFLPKDADLPARPPGTPPSSLALYRVLLLRRIALGEERLLPPSAAARSGRLRCQRSPPRSPPCAVPPALTPTHTSCL